MDNWDESVFVVNGFLRQCLNELTDELINVIIRFYNEADVHVLHGVSGDHWKILLADLLNDYGINFRA